MEVEQQQVRLSVFSPSLLKSRLTLPPPLFALSQRLTFCQFSLLPALFPPIHDSTPPLHSLVPHLPLLQRQESDSSSTTRSDRTMWCSGCAGERIRVVVFLSIAHRAGMAIDKLAFLVGDLVFLSLEK
jgi:hypothetical protein